MKWLKSCKTWNHFNFLSFCVEFEWAMVAQVLSDDFQQPPLIYSLSLSRLVTSPLLETETSFLLLLERCHKFSKRAVKRGIPAGNEPICAELRELTVAGGSTHRSHRHWRAPHSGSLCTIALISGGWGEKKWNGYIIAWGPRINTSSPGRYRLCQV